MLKHIIVILLLIPLGEPYRAQKTMPVEYFKLDASSIPGAGLGIFSTTFIPANTWLGEYEGIVLTIKEQKTSDSNLDYAWIVSLKYIHT